MNILVTGGAGFIGSHLIDKLLSLGHTVFSIDNFDSFYPRIVKENNQKKHFESKNFSFLECDITNEEVLLNFTKGKNIELIVHLAAKAGVRPSIENPAAYHHTNATGTLHLLNIAKTLKVKRFILASSSSVYGENLNVPWKESDTNLQPISPYAASKISAENMARVYSKLFYLDTVVFRFFTVYGPRQRPDLAIHKFFNLAYNNEEIPFFGDGSTRRDYTFIDDIVKGIIGAINLSSTDSKYNVYNLGNSNTVTLNELIETIKKITQKNIVLKKLPEQAGDVQQTFADVSKAGRELGFSPSTKITEGLALFNTWFKQHNRIPS